MLLILLESSSHSSFGSSLEGHITSWGTLLAAFATSFMAFLSYRLFGQTRNLVKNTEKQYELTRHQVQAEYRHKLYVDWVMLTDQWMNELQNTGNALNFSFDDAVSIDNPMSETQLEILSHRININMRMYADPHVEECARNWGEKFYGKTLNRFEELLEYVTERHSDTEVLDTLEYAQRHFIEAFKYIDHERRRIARLMRADLMPGEVFVGQSVASPLIESERYDTSLGYMQRKEILEEAKWIVASEDDWVAGWRGWDQRNYEVRATYYLSWQQLAMEGLARLQQIGLELDLDFLLLEHLKSFSDHLADEDSSAAHRENEMGLILFSDVDIYIETAEWRSEKYEVALKRYMDLLDTARLGISLGETNVILVDLSEEFSSAFRVLVADYVNLVVKMEADIYPMRPVVEEEHKQVSGFWMSRTFALLLEKFGRPNDSVGGIDL